MAVSTVPHMPRDGTLAWLNSAGATVLTAVYENGDVSGEGSRRADRQVIRDRGTIVAVRKGDDPVVTLSCTMHLLEFTNASAATFCDVAEFTGSQSAASKTTGIKGDYNFLTCKFTSAKQALGDSADAVIQYADCITNWSWGEGPPGTINVTIECYGTITRTGQA
ncbi:MAG TPA: hypothetical protein VFH61_06470 [Thermoleophilia bacterium]|nr:hypothetical protein [Thermoleophilia bacterium]